MSVNVPREVIVDDNETGIRYDGSWLLNNSQKSKSNPYSDSLHGTTGNAAFSYSFTGSDGLVLGLITHNSNDSANYFDAGAGPPPWECFLDGVSLAIPTPPDPGNLDDYSWPLCAWKDIPSEPHTISIHVDQLGNGQTLWFDSLIFDPGPNSIITNSTIYVNHNDAAIEYGDGWSIQNDSHVAVGDRSSLTFPFVGTALTLFANIPNDVPQKPSTALFSIDNQSPTNTTIVGDTKHKPQDQYNKLIYQTPTLPYGAHTLTVVSEGNPDVVPLILSYLVLDNSELPFRQDLHSNTATSSISSPSQTSSVLPSSGSSHHSSKENNTAADFPNKYRAIIGSVIGVLALLAFILLGYLCFRRRQSKRKPPSAEAGTLPSTIEAKRRVTIQPSSQQEYPFAQNSAPQLESNGYGYGSNLPKRFTSTSSRGDRPNSLFPVSRLSVLPTKGEPPDTPRSYHPYVSRFRRFSNFSRHSRLTSASSVTLLPHSPRRLSDDETAIMGSRDSHSSGKFSHSRPPDTTAPPPYTTG